MTIDCMDYLRLLSESLDAPLDASAQQTLDGHLSTCPACVGRMQDTIVLRESLRGLGEIERDDPPAPLEESLVTRILAAGRLARMDGAKPKQGIA